MSDIFKDFDKKNEVPKVKIPKFATGGICNDAIFPTFDMFSEIDEIVKDITKKKDNVMAMEFTKCIGELLRKNGVVLKISEYRMENHAENHAENKIEMRYGVSIDGLDFSEHDKVFENKIAELKKDYKTASGLLGKYQQENEALKKRIIELENFSCQAEQETESLVEKLNQRISELESKETEKPTKINLNDQIKVKLTPLGAEIYYHQYDKLNKKIKGNGGNSLEPRMPQIDKDGYTKMQLHEFISLYGEHIGMCKPNVIEPLDIMLVE